MDTPHEDDIRDRAYALWVEAGSPDGQNDEFWHRAERELAEQAGPENSDTTPGVTQILPMAGLPVH